LAVDQKTAIDQADSLFRELDRLAGRFIGRKWREKVEVNQSVGLDVDPQPQLELELEQASGPQDGVDRGNEGRL
jgi:hypothetical protein